MRTQGSAHGLLSPTCMLPVFRPHPNCTEVSGRSDTPPDPQRYRIAVGIWRDPNMTRTDNRDLTRLVRRLRADEPHSDDRTASRQSTAWWARPLLGPAQRQSAQGLGELPYVGTS